MPSPLQTASARRKVVYLGLILAIFVVNTFLWRGVASPLAENKVLPWTTLQSQAAALELTETAQGEPDLIGSTVRLVLTGSRGLAVTILWHNAIEKQKRNEWNELEFIVRTLTKLQPHFLTPWLFQSWNLTYNVSVESDQVKDKYFYIGRGIELLAQGERLNKDNPDMRYWMGFYYQNKFSFSDEGNALRSLFQLSCIPVDQRNPDVLAPKDPQGRRKVDLQKFEEFCRQHPRLVRRLREPPKELRLPFRCATPEDVVKFLEDCRHIPSRFVDPDEEHGKLVVGKAGDLKPQDQQFPVLPTRVPRYESHGPEPTSADTLGEEFDAFTAARVWFSYAQDPLPDPEPMTDILERKDKLKKFKDKRLPRQPAEVLFRQSPCRAQSYVGEWLQKEGWFDDSGWAVDGGLSGLGRWFPPRRDELVVGAGKDYTMDAWRRAYTMWREFGLKSGMYFEGTTYQILQDLAKKFRDKFQIAENDVALPFHVDQMSDDMKEALRAHKQLVLMNQNRDITNFKHHFVKANAERDRITAQARKTIDRAESYRRAAEPERAIETYEQGFAQWKQVLLNYKEFREDSGTQEDVYETEVHYLDLIQDHRGEQLRPLLAFDGLAATAAASAAGAGSPAPISVGLIYRLVTDNRALPLPVLGPLDGTDPDGKPWIEQSAVTTVRQRLAQERPQPAPKPAAKQPAAKGG
jgi:hypothetical protein